MQMKKLSIIVLFLLLLGSLAYFTRIGVTSVKADSLCPDGYTDKQCYDYLIKKKNSLSSERKKIESSLKKIQVQEGDIVEELNQLKNQIKDNEYAISEKQVEVELKSIEIRNIGNEIGKTKTKIDTLKQEISNTYKQIDNAIMLGFKINSIPTWYLVAQNDLISAIETLRYLDYVKKDQQAKLNHYTIVQSQLTSEEKILATAQAEIISKRNDLEKDNLDLIQLKSALKAKQSQQSQLLANLATMEKKLQAQKKQIASQQNQADREAASIAMKLYSEGKLGAGTKVSKGTIIGFQGHTGCSYGSHLHFGLIRSSNKWQYAANVDPFAEGLLRKSGNYIVSGKGSAPYSGALITQWFHEGRYLDMVSTSEGNQSGSRYFIAKGSLKCNTSYSGYHYLRGEGAPVRAILAGTVYRGSVDRYGGNFVIIDHGNNLRSAYYHLR